MHSVKVDLKIECSNSGRCRNPYPGESIRYTLSRGLGETCQNVWLPLPHFGKLYSTCIYQCIVVVLNTSCHVAGWKAAGDGLSKQELDGSLECQWAQQQGALSVTMWLCMHVPPRRSATLLRTMRLRHDIISLIFDWETTHCCAGDQWSSTFANTTGWQLC